MDATTTPDDLATGAGELPGRAELATSYRAGIVGGGFMGQVHAHAVRANGGVVAAVASSTPASAGRAAERIGATRAAAGVDQLVTSSDVDVVHVCTPNHLHHEVAMAAIAAGKHVVCEKPLATTPQAADELVAAADTAGVVATVPFVYRFHPMVREARQRVASGGIGRVLLVHGSYLQDWMMDPMEDNWRVDAELGGASRAFADVGSHWCDLLEFVTGDRIATLSARMVTAHDHRGPDRDPVDTEDIATMSFTTTAGVTGSTVISQVSPGRKNGLVLEISGEQGTLAFDQERPDELWRGDRVASQALVRDPEVLSQDAARLSRVPAGHPMGYQDCFDSFVADTATAVAGEAPDGLPTFVDGLRSTRIVQAVIDAAAGNTWVEVAA